MLLGLQEEAVLYLFHLAAGSRSAKTALNLVVERILLFCWVLYWTEEK